MSMSGMSAHNVTHSYIALEKICELLKRLYPGLLEEVSQLWTKLLLTLLTSTLHVWS